MKKKIPIPKSIKYLQKIIKEKFSNLKVMPLKLQEASRIPNKLSQKKEVPLPHNNQNTKCIEQRKNIKNSKGKKSK